MTVSDLKQKNSEIEDYLAAVGRIDSEFRKEMHLASVKLCESVRPEHSRLAKAFANAVIQMRNCHAEYFEFLDAVEATGASNGSLKPVFPSYIDSPLNRSSFYHWTLKDFRENGHIEMNEIPEAVR